VRSHRGHRRRSWRRALIGLAGGLSSLLACAVAEGACDASRDAATIAAAVRLVPDGRRLTVRAVDPEATGDPAVVRRLDAFVLRDRNGDPRPVVYVNCRSATFEAAAAGSDFYIKVLAAIIHHERCHLDGLDERAAVAAERVFFVGLIQAGLVPAAEGLAHLRLLDHTLRAP
jgi:hypothetical protein